MKVILRIFIMVLLHMVVFVLVHDIGARLASLMFDISKGGLSWGVTVKYSIIVFSIIVIALSILREYSDRLEVRNIWVVISCLLFVGLFIMNVKYSPFRTILLLLSGLLGIIIPELLYGKFVSSQRYS